MLGSGELGLCFSEAKFLSDLGGCSQLKSSLQAPYQEPVEVVPVWQLEVSPQECLIHSTYHFGRPDWRR